MQTPLLPILFRFGLAITGLYVVAAAIMLPADSPVLGGASVPIPDLIARGMMGAMGLLLMYVASKAIWGCLDESREEAEVEDEEHVALCTTCLAEVNPLHHYCPKCGDAIGRYTGYVPFVNIPFEFNFLGRVWHRVWREPDVPVRKRVILFVVMTAIAPIMLIGLPFVLLERVRPRRETT